MNILCQWSESHYEGAQTRRRFSIQTEKLQITISSIILKIFTAGADLSCRRREGGKRRQVISCCTVRVHFPDGLSSLLPDLVCVVLHGQVISVGSRTAVHPFIHITRICVSLSHWLVYILSRAPSRGFGRALVFLSQKVPFGLHARSTGITRGFIWTFFACVCHVRTGIITFPPACAPRQPMLVLHHRPGDDISGIMSIFCAHFKPPPPGKNDQRLTCHSLMQR